MKDSRGIRISAKWFSIKRWICLVLRRFRSQEILAVYEDDLDGLLEKLDLFEKVTQGKFKCMSCNCTISRENLGVIKNENGAIQIYCISTGCKLVVNEKENL